MITDIKNDYLTLKQLRKYKKIKYCCYINKKSLENLNILPEQGLYKKSDIDLLAKLMSQDFLRVNFLTKKIEIVEHAEKVDIQLLSERFNLMEG